MPLRIMLINPNSSETTTAMMTAIAQGYAPDWVVEGASATYGPPMITDETALKASGPEVVRLGLAAAVRADIAGIVVAAYGDPGFEDLAAALVRPLPLVGIGEASMEEAAAGGRRFGVATTTPDLAEAIRLRAIRLGHGALFTGVCLTREDPLRLAANPIAQTTALREAVEEAVRAGAEAVIIGGGPLGESAAALADVCPVPVIAPLGAAMRKLRRLVTEE